MITKIKNLAIKRLYIIVVLLFVANLLYVWQSPAMKSLPMSHDEYIFYRLTMNLPDGYTKVAWLDDDPVMTYAHTDEYMTLINKLAYDTPIWIHPLIDNYLSYPILKMFSNPIKQIQWIRLICVAFIIATVLLMADVIKRKTNQYMAMASLFLFVIARLLLASAIYFYYDLFMWLFFALTIWVIEKKPASKWIIPLTILTVMSKVNAVLLLLPIGLYLYHKQAINIKRIGLPMVAVLAYLVFQAIVAKDSLYLLHHWGGTLNEWAKMYITKVVFPRIMDFVLSWGLYIYVPIIIAGIAIIIKNRLRAYYAFGAMGIIVMLYGFAWGWFAYQVYPIIYVSMFMMPLIVPIFVDVTTYKVMQYELK